MQNDLTCFVHTSTRAQKYYNNDQFCAHLSSYHPPPLSLSLFPPLPTIPTPLLPKADNNRPLIALSLGHTGLFFFIIHSNTWVGPTSNQLGWVNGHRLKGVTRSDLQ